jgi:hypothetical protein
MGDKVRLLKNGANLVGAFTSRTELNKYLQNLLFSHVKAIFAHEIKLQRTHEKKLIHPVVCTGFSTNEL